MHEVGVVCFRQIIAPGPFVPNPVAVFISDCVASWSMKPCGAELTGSQCNCEAVPKVPASKGHGEEGGLPSS